jgi:hypothetical protein
MKLFQCQNCGQPLYFENTLCESCGLALGYLAARETITALRPDTKSVSNPNAPPRWKALAVSGRRYRYCANYAHGACNWLVRADNPDPFCAACRHNRTIPDLTVPENLAHWRMLEGAKHRLFYTLLKLRLPLVTRLEDPAGGLAFDFLVDGAQPVLTGHDNGLITINLAEADDAERERRRHQMGEPYRTLLGHFRHEIAHYYWNLLVANSPSIEQFRELFGDERRDYGEALQTYYANGAPADWPERFVSAYAGSHPWEDWAETWAHYFHMVDTLETAGAFGIAVKAKASHRIATKIDFDPHTSDMKRLIEGWLPLTFAVNSINRSMGLHDLYPFVLSPPAIAKLSFVHNSIRAQAGHAAAPEGSLLAMIAGLRQLSFARSLRPR